MRKQPASETRPAETVTVLSVSPLREDHHSLQSIFHHSRWKLFTTDTSAAALAFLRAKEVPVVLCESDLPPFTFRELLDQMASLPNMPAVIVSSRLADERLWAEALNLGAWDVLSKPFIKDEVFQAVSAAWRHWRNGREIPTMAAALRAAG